MSRRGTHLRAVGEDAAGYAGPSTAGDRFLGFLAYASDDGTSFTLRAGGKSLTGKVSWISSTSCIVEFDAQEAA